jgi:ketosteroid isomerase-like protein
MSMNLPPLIQNYIAASNAHDVKSILACFSDDAVVRDENETHRGKIEIERWITTTIEKYKFQFKPLGASNGDVEPIVTVEVSGTFPGSLVTLDYHFKIDNDSISSLSID